jgi:hypothetical protein
MPAKPSAVIDTRVIYCGDNLDQLRKLVGFEQLLYLRQPGYGPSYVVGNRSSTK